MLIFRFQSNFPSIWPWEGTQRTLSTLQSLFPKRSHHCPVINTTPSHCPHPHPCSTLSLSSSWRGRQLTVLSIIWHTNTWLGAAGQSLGWTHGVRGQHSSHCANCWGSWFVGSPHWKRFLRDISAFFCLSHLSQFGWHGWWGKFIYSLSIFLRPTEIRHKFHRPADGNIHVLHMNTIAALKTNLGCGLL